MEAEEEGPFRVSARVFHSLKVYIASDGRVGTNTSRFGLLVCLV